MRRAGSTFIAVIRVPTIHPSHPAARVALRVAYLVNVWGTAKTSSLAVAPAEGGVWAQITSIEQLVNKKKKPDVLDRVGAGPHVREARREPVDVRWACDLDSAEGRLASGSGERA